MKCYTLEDIAAELHSTPGTARNGLMLGQDMPPSIRIGRRRLFPVTEFDKWVAQVIAPLQEAPRKDAVLFLVIAVIGLAGRAQSPRTIASLEHRRHELGLGLTAQAQRQIRAHGPGGRCDDDGYCWPSVPTLARKTSLDDRSVQRILNQLKADGLLRVEPRYRKDGSTSNGYRLRMDPLVTQCHHPSRQPVTRW